MIIQPSKDNLLINTPLCIPPLSLYIHIPWCVQKCPYCDFNSHALKQNQEKELEELNYIEELIKDLDSDIAMFGLKNRPLHSIFIGGGTPSLFSPFAIKTLLNQVLSRFEDEPNIEITLEANPGTVEADKFIGFVDAGVTRLSIGIQSFESDKLIKLGRIHDSKQAQKAAVLAKQSGIKSFNLDLMHGLPEQTIENALDDLKKAINLQPDHISWYQLTIEPNTAFYSKPPTLPQDEVLWDIQDQGFEILKDAGYQQYEISAFSKTDKQCQHNLNYWQFGDYIGIGCGAHGKITNSISQTIQRTIKVKHPKGYLDTSRKHIDSLIAVKKDELAFEFMMNNLRLFSPFSLISFQQRTGLSLATILPTLHLAEQKNLMKKRNINKQEHWQVTTLGHRYLNDLLALFL